MQGYNQALETVPSENNQKWLSKNIEAVADIKFTYIVSCQRYGHHKRTQDRRALDILNLMKELVVYLSFNMFFYYINFFQLIPSSFSLCRYPSLRVAYIDEVEVLNKKEYYSKLVKVVLADNDDRNATEQVGFYLRCNHYMWFIL